MSFKKPHPSWRKCLSADVFIDALEVLQTISDQSSQPYDKTLLFSPFEMDLEKVQVIVLFDEPCYLPGISLGNPFTETSYPTGYNSPLHSFLKVSEVPFREDLGRVMSQSGVLGLYAALTVGTGNEKSHQELWRPVMQKIIHKISSKIKPIIWVLWGENAYSYRNSIVNSLFVNKYDEEIIEKIPADPCRNYVIFSSNPFEEEANPFIKANIILKRFRKNPIF